MAHLGSHLSDEQMVALLDGEAEKNSAAQARAHLETCWQCRSRMHDIEASVRTFVEARELVRPEAEQLPPAPVEQFRQRLMHHAAQQEPGTQTSFVETVAMLLRPARIFVASHRRAALAAVAAVAILLATFTDLINTTASAESILLRAQTFESRRAPGSGQVARTSVHVQSFNRVTHAARDLGSIAWVQDSATAASEVDAKSPALANQTQILRDDAEAGGWIARWMQQASDLAPNTGIYLASRHWRPEVSVREFRKLIEARGATGTSVEHGDGLYTVHYPFAANHISGIAEALLSVRSNDFEPVRVSLITGSGEAQTEYRFESVGFAVSARTPELAKVFDSASTANDATARTPHDLPGPTFRPVPVAYLATTPTEVEVAAIAALHKVDACLGEEVNVFPMSDGSVMVQGLVDRTERRDAIRRALSNVHGDFTVHVITPGEVHSAADLLTPPDQIPARSPAGGHASTMTLADLSSEQMPIYVQLMAHFSANGRSHDDAQEQVAAFSNELVNSARQSLLHAWAMKRLDHEFPAERTASLSPEQSRTIEQIRSDHRRWIAILSRRQREMLAQIGVEAVAGKPLPDDASSDLILQTAEAENSLIRSLFTVSSDGGDTSGALSRLLSLLEQLGG